MRVLMSGPAKSPHTLRPLEWLLQDGHDVIFMDDVNPFPDGRAKYTYVPAPERDDVNAVSYLKEVVAITKPDIIHIHWINQTATRFVDAGIRPLIYSAWGTDINAHFTLDMPTSIARHLIGKTLRGADAIIVDAPLMAERCSQLAQCNVNCSFIHLGADINLFRRGYEDAAFLWKRRLDIPENGVLFISPRIMNANYNQHEILQAFSIAYPHFGKKAYLAFKVFFSNKSYEMEIRRRSIELGIAHQVKWIPELPSERLPELYALADAIITNPKIDTLPVTLIEAAACCTPAITCHQPTYNGTFIERYCRLFPLGDIEALSGEMIRFVNQSKEERIGSLTRARAEILTDFNQSHYVRKLVALYYQTISRQPPHH